MSGYSILALAPFVAWVLLAGVGRMLVQRKRTGDSGFRFAAAPRGTVQWWANRISGAGSVAVGLAGPIADMVGLDPVAPLSSPVLRTAAVLVTAVGVAGTYAAQLAMGTAWRIGVDPAERTALVTSGPFALVRNPSLPPL